MFKISSKCIFNKFSGSSNGGSGGGSSGGSSGSGSSGGSSGSGSIYLQRLESLRLKHLVTTNLLRICFVCLPHSYIVII